MVYPMFVRLGTKSGSGIYAATAVTQNQWPLCHDFSQALPILSTHYKTQALRAVQSFGLAKDRKPL